MSMMNLTKDVASDKFGDYTSRWTLNNLVNS